MLIAHTTVAGTMAVTSQLKENLNIELCKGCDPYGQLLCGMLQVPTAVQTLHTHSMAAHRCRTGAYNTPVTTQWLVQRLCYGLVQTFGCG